MPVTIEELMQSATENDGSEFSTKLNSYVQPLVIDAVSKITTEKNSLSAEVEKLKEHNSKVIGEKRSYTAVLKELGFKEGHDGLEQLKAALSEKGEGERNLEERAKEIASGMVPSLVDEGIKTERELRQKAEEERKRYEELAQKSVEARNQANLRQLIEAAKNSEGVPKVSPIAEKFLFDRVKEHCQFDDNGLPRLVFYKDETAIPIVIDAKHADVASLLKDMSKGGGSESSRPWAINGDHYFLSTKSGGGFGGNNSDNLDTTGRLEKARGAKSVAEYEKARKGL